MESNNKSVLLSVQCLMLLRDFPVKLKGSHADICVCTHRLERDGGGMTSEK